MLKSERFATRAGQRGNATTTLELKLELPERIARQAEAAGLSTPKALSRLLKDEMQRLAAEQLLTGARHASESGSKPLSMKAIQSEVNEVRKARRAARSDA